MLCLVNSADVSAQLPFQKEKTSLLTVGQILDTPVDGRVTDDQVVVEDD